MHSLNILSKAQINQVQDVRPNSITKAMDGLFKSILLKEPFALKNSETVYFTSIFSTLSYSDIAPIDNFDLTFFFFYFDFEVFDTIQF